ncbi:MAG TPA: AsmA family protein, partial [Rhodospirillales bacterium]
PSGAYVVDGLAVSIGNSDISGRVTVKTPDGKAPAVDATLTSRLLDLDALAALSPATPAPAKADGKKAARVFSADPLPVDALKFADARIHLKAGKLIAAGVAVEDLDIGATLSGGRLEVKPLAATLAGGKVNGDATLDGTRPMPALSVNLDVRQVDYGTLLRALNLSDIASGKVDATLGLKGQGASVRAIMAGLDGRARIVSQGGRIESGLLNVLSADIASALPFIDSKSDNNIRCAVVDFDVRKGKAAARTLVFETGGLSMIGSGGIDLADETIAMNIDPRAKKLSVLKLTLVPVNVGGTLADPSVSADVGGAAVGAVTGAVKTAKDIASGGVSALGGLIGLGDKKDDAQARIDDTDYCKLALAGGPVRRVNPDAARPKPAATPAPAPTTPPAGRKDSTADKIDKKLDEIGKGLGGALKGLFGK